MLAGSPLRGEPVHHPAGSPGGNDDNPPRGSQRHGAYFQYNNWDFNVLGASYCYRRKWFEAQIGYFYRFMREGRQASPLFSLGAYL